MDDDYLDDPQIYKSYKSWLPHLRAIMISFGSLYIGIVITYFEIITYHTCKNIEAYENVTKIELYLTNNIVCFGAVFGCIFVSKKLYNRISRSKSLMIGCIIGAIGTLTVLSTCIFLKNNFFSDDKIGFLSLSIIYIGRFIQGIALGVFSVNCILFIYELSPLEIKIILGGFFQLFIQIGIIGTKAIGLLSIQKQYIILSCFALSSLILLFLFCIFFLKCETPKFLISKQKKQQAKSLISSIYKQECTRQIFLDKQAQYHLQIQASESSFFQTYNMNQIKRKALFLGIFVWMIQQVSGINFLNIYGSFNQQNEQYYAIIQSGFQFFGTAALILINCIQKCTKFFSKRQKLLKYGTYLILILLIANLILTTFQKTYNNTAQFIIVCIFMFIFGFSIGPVAWLYSPEIMEFSQLCFAIASMWIFQFLNVFIMQVLKLLKPAWLVNIWQSISILLFLIALSLNKRYKWIIQTRNKTKLEITRTIYEIQMVPQCIMTCCWKQN